MSRVPPSQTVLESFGISTKPLPLTGGNEKAWLADKIVLKPEAGNEERISWIAALFSKIREEGFRVERPLGAKNGRWTIDGWSAWTWVAGKENYRRLKELIEAADAFHAQVSSVPKPSSIDSRTDWWAIADRIAWGELPAQDLQVKSLEKLLAKRHQLNLPNQIVHGDLFGNVLFAEGLPPAIIDFSLYWRPPAYASVKAVVDALTWHRDIPDSALSYLHKYEEWSQIFLRAVIFRVVVDHLKRGDGKWLPDEGDPFLRVVNLALA